MEVFWRTADGRELNIGSMSLDHIRNCIWAIENGQAWLDGCNGFTNPEWLLIFQSELARRSRRAST